ncbi:MAG: MCP four helix bundle domain-containing protein, partial [Paucibacter sp.]|nr:MCP four helix bundle domain-containing protein [Roseateles sp.]
MIAFLLCLAALGYVSNNTLSTAIDALVRVDYQNTVLANRAKAELSDVSRGMMNTLIMTGDDQISKEISNVDALLKTHEQTMAELDKQVSDDEGRAILKDMEAVRAKFIPAEASFAKMIADGDKDQATLKYLFSVGAVQFKNQNDLDKFVQVQNEQMQAAGGRSTALVKRTSVIIGVLSLAATLASTFIGIFVTRSISGPLMGAVSVAREVASGNL